MKLAKKISVLALAFFSITATLSSAQALELVKTNSINPIEVMNEIKSTLADSIKLTPVSFADAQQTAQALLAKQQHRTGKTNSARLTKMVLISE